MKPWNKPEKANEWRTKLEQIEDIEEWQVTPQKHPHFHAKIRTTDLIWNDRCQVDNILFFYLFFYILLMTLQGAGYFDDESVWYPWIIP